MKSSRAISRVSCLYWIDVSRTISVIIIIIIILDDDDDADDVGSIQTPDEVGSPRRFHRIYSPRKLKNIYRVIKLFRVPHKQKTPMRNVLMFTLTRWFILLQVSESKNRALNMHARTHIIYDKRYEIKMKDETHILRVTTNNQFPSSGMWQTF